MLCYPDKHSFFSLKTVFFLLSLFFLKRAIIFAELKPQHILFLATTSNLKSEIERIVPQQRGFQLVLCIQSQ